MLANFKIIPSHFLQLEILNMLNNPIAKILFLIIILNGYNLTRSDLNTTEPNPPYEKIIQLKLQAHS